MRIKQSWTMVLALAASSASSASAAASIDAPIRSVTLYPGSATVERVIQVTPGMSQLEINGLLANFNTDTMRLQADPGIQIGQVITRDQGRADSPSPRAAELESRIQALDDQIALIDADVKSAQLVQSYLERLGGAGGEGGHPAPPDPKALAGTLDVIRRGGADALERVQGDEVRKRALNKQLEVLKQDLAKAQASTRDSRTMTVFLAARQAGRIMLSYQVNRAGWKPTYRASLDSNASTIELERMATISQKTGEDWSNVRLRLSTGQPNLSVYAPNPSSWLLTYQGPEEQAQSRFILKAPPAPVAMAPAPPPNMIVSGARDNYVAPVFQTQGNFSTEFEVPARVSLASDGREISVGLAKQSLQARQRVLIAPRSGGDAVVLTADSPRPEGVWLAGQVQLQRDGSYVGALYWDPQASERFQLAFGRDSLVRVAVEHRNDKSGETGFLSHGKEKRVDDSYVVTSFHRQPVDIVVLEPTPVSQSDKVSVKVTLDPEPSVKEWEHRRGLVAWETTLKPNQTARFDVGYVIDYPAEGQVFGLR